MSSNRFSKADFLAGAVVMCLAMLAGAGCDNHPGGKVESNRYTALGEVMALKMNELAGGKGRVVLVVAESDNNQPTAFGQAAAAFRKALGKSVQITATEMVSTPAVSFPGFEPLSTDKFAGLLQKHADADYLVSFVGMPVLTPAQMDQLPSPRPQVVQVVVFNPPTKAMFAKRVVCLAALTKPAAQGADLTGSSQEMFDACYRLVTPETAASLPR